VNARKLAAALALLLPLACSGSDRDAGPSPAASANPTAAPSPSERAELVTLELSLVPKDDETLLAVRHRIAAPWHIYWTNPGESGLATRVRVAASGVEVGEPRFPGPDRFVASGGQISYGWAEEVIVFVPLTGIASEASVQVTSEWLACHESCIPGRSEASTRLAALAPDPSASLDPSVRAMLDRLPEPAGERLRASWSGMTLTVRASDSDAVLVELFPHAIEHVTLASQALVDATLILDYRVDAGATIPSDAAQGLVLVREGDRRHWLELDAGWPPYP
jgi:DsbC/DsbD-like thiol-disulfide interchange protein